MVVLLHWSSSRLCRMIVATVVFQLLMFGVVGLKQSYAASVLLLPLPVITVLFYFVILQHYIRPAANLALSAAHGLKEPAPNFIQASWVCVGHTDKPIDGHSARPIDLQTNWPTAGSTDRPTDQQTDGKTDKQIVKPSTYRLTDRQTDRHTNSQTTWTR